VSLGLQALLAQLVVQVQLELQGKKAKKDLEELQVEQEQLG
jgi:hypothetical protein